MNILNVSIVVLVVTAACLKDTLFVLALSLSVRPIHQCIPYKVCWRKDAVCKFNQFQSAPSPVDMVL